MPRYYFNLYDRTTTIDREGVVLPNLAAARDMALKSSGDLLRVGPSASVWDGTPWKMWVTGEDGNTVFTLSFSATNA